MENQQPSDPTYNSPETAANPAPLTPSEKTMGMVCHLISLIGFIGIPFGNIIGPLVIWLIKKDKEPFVDACGKESLNFQISLTIYSMVAFLLFFVLIGMVLLPILLIAGVVLVIMASIKANEGTVYRYPLTIRFIK